jgi:hypothetical protein
MPSAELDSLPAVRQTEANHHGGDPYQVKQASNLKTDGDHHVGSDGEQNSPGNPTNDHAHDANPSFAARTGVLAVTFLSLPKYL